MNENDMNMLQTALDAFNARLQSFDPDLIDYLPEHCQITHADDNILIFDILDDCDITIIALFDNIDYRLRHITTYIDTYIDDIILDTNDYTNSLTTLA